MGVDIILGCRGFHDIAVDVANDFSDIFILPFFYLFLISLSNYVNIPRDATENVKIAPRF